MLPIILILVLTTILVVGLLMYKKIQKKDGSYSSDGEGWQIISVLVGCCLFTFLIVWVCIYFNSVQTQLELKAFLNTNKENYEYSIDKTESMLTILPSTSKLVDGSIEKTQLASTVSERIKEFRDAVVRYNTRLYSYKAWSTNPLTFMFYSELDKSLVTIKIK